ncbi:MAG TPA: hypothetical protein VGN11_08540 [Candidatus Baltobacteraceae bacterium]|jgi:hypothetical protein|nr:hypothetical protein [Candidatus Baltobacteraceae bacterium]
MKQFKRATPAFAIGGILVLCGAVAALAAGLDGGVIANSGSTNTAPYTIKVWSDGHGNVSVANATATAFNVDPAVAAKFFTDVKEARANPGTPGRCMKSASFGTRTNVLWHEWTSSDLQCPPFSPSVSLLAHDVQQIQQAANVGMPMRRMRAPIQNRMTPPSESETPHP